MTVVRAFVVGIDRYDCPEWAVRGPAMAAQTVAQWLLGLADVTLELDLFLGTDDALEPALQAAVDNKQVRLNRSTTAGTFKTFARKTLLDNVAPGTQLFIYWCGHGVTCGASGDRVLMCEDFDVGFEDNVFNATDLLKRLRTFAYSGFDRQFLLVDACGNYATTHGLYPIEYDDQSHTLQLSYFASQPGKDTKSPAAGGTFTKTALGVLAGFGGYPSELDALDARLNAAYQALQSEPFRILSLSNKVEHERWAGPADRAGLTRHLDAALKLMSEHDIIQTRCRVHYEKTVADFGQPAAAKANDFTGMLEDLCEIGRRIMPGEISDALLQFMERLAAVPELGEIVNPWLAEQAPGKGPTREAIRHKLKLETLGKTLLIVVRDEAGDIAAMRPYLCLSDGSFDESFKQDEVACAGWNALVAQVQAVLRHFEVGGMLSNLQVQFVVDPPLLDYPFHQIPTSAGMDLGSMVPVVLRYRWRLQGNDLPLRKLWIDFTNVLISKQFQSVTWLCIDKNEALPVSKGLCFAKFSVPPPAGKPAGASALKTVIWRLLLQGAPVVYVPHADPDDGQWDQVESALKTMSREPAHFNTFVQTFQQARLGGNLHASRAALFWDDPRFNPFQVHVP